MRIRMRASANRKVVLTMDTLTLITNVLVIVGGALLAIFLKSFGAGAEAAAAEGAREGITRLNWDAILARELQRARGMERQELRFTSYGKLWAQMGALAIYDDTAVDRDAMRTLSKALSTWYFSAEGGLMLTSHNRDMYFAFQDVVSRTAGAADDWRATRSVEPGTRFPALLEGHTLRGAQALLEYYGKEVPTDWPAEDLVALAGAWRRDIRTLTDGWGGLSEEDRFVVLQQVGSVLRTGLSYDVESRLR
jgi:hypothetical protein